MSSPLEPVSLAQDYPRDRAGVFVFGAADHARVAAGTQALREAQRHMERRSPAEHAAALLQRMQQAVETCGALTSDDVQDIYHDMLIELNWWPAVWRDVGSALRRLTGTPKRYGQRDANGHRPSMFDIPAADAADLQAAA